MGDEARLVLEGSEPAQPGRSAREGAIHGATADQLLNSRGTMTTREIVHVLTPLHFGEFLGSEYNEATRKLVDLGAIERKSRKGINENEHLKFVAMRSSL
jgi:hypothetical protein